MSEEITESVLFKCEDGEDIINVTPCEKSILIQTNKRLVSISDKEEETNSQ